MNIDKARELIAQALAELGPALPPEPSTIVIRDPLALDIALASAAPGAVLTLGASLVYPVALTLQKTVALQAETVLTGRMTKDGVLPTLAGGVKVLADDVTLVGLDVRHINPLTDIVVISGARVTLDRCRILGDPVKGAKRGIAANGGGDCIIRQCYVDDCFATYPGSDSQAICAWDMGPGLTIEDCYLSGGSETILIGGADPVSEARAPRDITIVGNIITKNPAWMALPIGVKNVLELKNARHVHIADNDISYSWGGHGQDGVAIMLTPRNQDGRAPFSTVEDVLIVNNRIAHAAGAIAILGTDNNHPSGRLSHVQISANVFTDMDPLVWEGTKKLIQIQRGPLDVAITDNTFQGANSTSVIYFDSLPLCEQLVVTGNSWPVTKYKIFGSGATVGKAWEKFVASGELSGNLETS